MQLHFTGITVRTFNNGDLLPPSKMAHTLEQADCTDRISGSRQPRRGSHMTVMGSHMTVMGCIMPHPNLIIT